MEYTWLTLKQIGESERYPFNYNQMRGYMSERSYNGLHRAVRKVGKHLLIREDLFNEWIDSQKV